MKAHRLVGGLLVSLGVLAAGAGADQLSDAMAQADALGLFTTIGLQQVQAQAMVAPLERIQSQVTQYQAAEQQRLTALAPTLTRARQ
ncbi:MAG: hypothetical protein AB7Y46_04105, partial [Armatimonadota bacterium]